MRLHGWNWVPEGATATFDVEAAPTWLRLLARIPFCDRFAYPMLVSKGLGRLQVFDAANFDHTGAAKAGWVVLPPGYLPRGARVELDHDSSVD